MWNSRSLVLVLLALAAAGASVQGGAASSPASPGVGESKKSDPFEDLSFAALEKRVALNALRKQLSADRAGWPKGDVPGLDFTKATGNAIVVHLESGQHSNPIGGVITGAPAFKLFHVEDDPYRLATLARG